MNKKLISILIIISILSVGLTCISAVDESVVTSDYEITDDENTESSEEIYELTSTPTTDEDTNTDNDTNESEEYREDVVVPTNVEDLRKTEILMNFLTPEGKADFADELTEIDSTSYAEVIDALKNNDIQNILPALAKLDQDKIDTFFTKFLEYCSDITSGTSSNNNPTTDESSNSVTNTISDSISNTLSNIFGTSNSQKSVNYFFSTNPTIADNNYPSQNNIMYQYNGKWYSPIDFVNILSEAYIHGTISYEQFIQVLEDNGFDTSDISLEDGIINWGLLTIIPDESPVEDNVNVTDTTVSDTSSDDTSDDITEYTETTSNDDVNSSE